jgi:hypothetical protein
MQKYRPLIVQNAIFDFAHSFRLTLQLYNDILNSQDKSSLRLTEYVEHHGGTAN